MADRRTINLPDLTPDQPKPVTCPPCDGWGTRRVRARTYEESDPDPVTCPACGGAGVIAWPPAVQWSTTPDGIKTVYPGPVHPDWVVRESLDLAVKEAENAAELEASQERLFAALELIVANEDHGKMCATWAITPGRCNCWEVLVRGLIPTGEP